MFCHEKIARPYNLRFALLSNLNFITGIMCYAFCVSVDPHPRFGIFRFATTKLFISSMELFF
jgi:hypothetical protein